LHGDHLGSTVLETSTTGAITADQRYRAYGRQRDTGPVVTDHKFTAPSGHPKLDGTGLMYYNSRYYDPVIGAFISPDTIVPDATNLFDYNRYMYVRGRVLNMNDPTGHYSNDEIIQHFGCDSWECVEGHFSDGGSHAGMWGWLYVLQEAQNGDLITAESIGSGNLGSQHSFLSGTFTRSANGTIGIAGGSLTYANAQVHQFDASISELAYAQFATNGAGYGKYTLQGTNGSYYDVDSSSVHLRTKLQPGNIDPIDLGIAVLKSGETAGPLVAKAPHPLAKSAGGIWYTLGKATSLTVDFVGAGHELIQGRPLAAIETAGGEITNRLTGTPAYSNAYDLGKVLSQGICIGTGCR
jgi:RHS repeat-associated protein